MKVNIFRAKSFIISMIVCVTVAACDSSTIKPAGHPSLQNLNELINAAENGDSKEQVLLALEYDKNGHFAESEEWLEKAANSGHAVAQIALCTMVFPKEDMEIIKWWIAASKNGNSFAESKLKNAFNRNRSQSLVDIVHSYMWCEIAQHQDKAWVKKQAKQEQVALALLMPPDEILESDRLANLWLAAHSEALQIP